MKKVNPIKVLLIEDDKPTAKIFTDYFSQLPTFEIVAVAEGSTEAIQMTKEHQPSVVLIDISLREGDGTEYVEELMQGELGKSLPFRPYTLIITQYDTDSIRDTLDGFGVDCFFAKDEIDFSAGAVAEHMIKIEDDLPRLKAVAV